MLDLFKVLLYGISASFLARLQLITAMKVCSLCLELDMCTTRVANNVSIRPCFA
jgi:hypothetical protein